MSGFPHVLALLNAGGDAAREALYKCCSSTRWTERMLKGIPFASFHMLCEHADENWFSLEEKDWLEAFAGHPKIGDLNALKKKWAQQEQGAVAEATEATLQELARLNAEYEQKFAFIFIVCATGKSAAEMLELLKARLPHSRSQELQNAALEQSKITRLRLEKL